jgi:hypothetical protein
MAHSIAERHLRGEHRALADRANALRSAMGSMIPHRAAGQTEAEQRLRFEPLRIGALGTGGFGLFALRQFMQVPGVELAAMGATHREAALAMTRRFGIPAVDGDELLSRKDLHYAQTMKALPSFPPCPAPA